MAIPLIIIGIVLLFLGYGLFGAILLILGLVFLFGYQAGPGPYYGRRR